MRKFKTESQKVLDIMINSIYTNKEIFLRELISNCSDAIDKLYYQSLTQNIGGLSRESFAIEITPDKEARTIIIRDNGIGMSADELDSHLGVIAHSGSQEFKNAAEHEDIDIIGQFGVGFYSAFMVAKKVRVRSRKYGEENAHAWLSNGTEGYEIKPTELEGHGTEITLWLKDNTEEENFDQYVEEYVLRRIIKRYSDYIRYPIRMPVTVYGEEESRVEVQTINSMTPLWVRNKNEIGEEDYNEFYRSSFFDQEDPLLSIHARVEGKVDYKALLFVPAKAPYDYYSKSYEKGLKLYTSGVMISEKCADLLPDCFSFVRGLVDCDLPLNISRETIQQNHQLKAIAEHIKGKIQKELLALLKKDREKYVRFYRAFGLQLRYGVYADWGLEKDLLKDLLLFDSVGRDAPITLAEYVESMPEGQDKIYYGVGKTKEAVRAMPQTEALVDKGYDILCFDQDIDEFAIRVLQNYQEKEFVSIAAVVADEEDKPEGYDEVLAFAKEHLAEKVGEIKLTKRLKTHAVCLTAAGEISLEMERVLNALPNANGVKAERVLEFNAEHAVFGKLCRLFATDKDACGQLLDILYDHACLMAGLEVSDPAAYVDRVTRFLAE